MPLLIKKTKSGLKDSLKSAGYKLPHGYDIKKRKTTKRKRSSKRK